MTDGTARPDRTHYTSTPGYTGLVVDVPLAPCCRTVFLGEVCECLEAAMASPGQSIHLDLRAKAVAGA